MSLRASISWIERKDIDTLRWDALIAEASNSRIYAYSWWLDHMADRWGALVMGDYEYVMPLPYNRKLLGFRQIYQPFFTQQLGVFGREKVTAELSQAFLQSIPAHFVKVVTFLNSGMELPVLEHISERVNLELKLHRSYNDIHHNYSKSLKKRLAKFSPNFTFERNQYSAQEIVQLAQTHLGSKLQLSDKVYARWQSLIEDCLRQDRGFIGALRHQDPAVVCVGFFPVDQHRIYNPFTIMSSEAKPFDATYVLLNQVIEQHPSAKVFDFEGSQLPGVVEFYQRFGGGNVPYYGFERKVWK